MRQPTPVSVLRKTPESSTPPRQHTFVFDVVDASISLRARLARRLACAQQLCPTAVTSMNPRAIHYTPTTSSARLRRCIGDIGAELTLDAGNRTVA
jgi:hypothetical protein